MSDVSRPEFDALVERVSRIERTLGPLVEIVATEIVGLRSYLQETMVSRLDGIETKLDSYTVQVNTALQAQNKAEDRQHRFMAAIADHFNIDLHEERDQ